MGSLLDDPCCSFGAQLGCCHLGRARNCTYGLDAGACWVGWSVVLFSQLLIRREMVHLVPPDCVARDPLVDLGARQAVVAGCCAGTATTPSWQNCERPCQCKDYDRIGVDA